MSPKCSDRLASEKMLAQPHRKETEMASISTGGRERATPKPQAITLVIDFPQGTERLELEEMMSDLWTQVQKRSEEWLEEKRPGVLWRGLLQVSAYEIERNSTLPNGSDSWCGASTGQQSVPEGGSAPILDGVGPETAPRAVAFELTVGVAHVTIPEV